MHSKESINERKEKELVLKITKEIAVKFIETGRVTPANFDSTFRNIYNTIEATVEQEQANDKS